MLRGRSGVNSPFRHILFGAIGMIVLLLAIVLLIVLTGGYNVAATDRHNPLVAWALSTTMRNHVQDAAEDVGEPPAVTPAMIAAGAGRYKSMCAHCHGGVGAGRAEWAKAMRPMPPPLAHAAQRWSIEEVHWIVHHGVKMSGMPAFGPTHDEEAIWTIAAFVEAMPKMSAEQYASYGSAEGGHSHQSSSHSHEGHAASH